MKVVIREAAYADLERIHAWIAKDNPRAAVSVVNRIFDTIDRLGLFPGLDVIDETSQELTVVAIFHGAQHR